MRVTAGTTMPTALISGITGQDGSYLADLLIAKGYRVHGLVRRSSNDNTERLRLALATEQLTLHWGEMTDALSLRRVVDEVEPDEVYNLAAQSHVGVSFEVPVYTGDVVALGTTRLLEAVRACVPDARFYQASSCEVFGRADQSPQSEATPFRPRNPYAAAKAYAFHITRNYREAYGMHTSNGILFNHESERRGERFVTRKITRAVGRIVAGTQQFLYLGNLEARRDWGHAEDHVEAMWRMLQREEGDDFIVAMGVSHSVKDFAQAAFAVVDLDWEDHVRVDPKFLRPADIPELIGDPSRAREHLDWAPRHDFEMLVERMVRHDVALAEGEK